MVALPFRFGESFDHYAGSNTHGKWSEVGVQFNVVANGGRRGRGAVHFTGDNGTLTKSGLPVDIGTPHTENIGLAIKFEAWPSVNLCFLRMTPDSFHNASRFELNPTTHQIEVWVVRPGPSPTLRGTSGPLALGQWYHLGFWQNTNGVAGGFPSALQLDNSTQYLSPGTSGAVQDQTTTTIALNFTTNHSGPTPASVDYWIDDFYFLGGIDPTATVPSFAGDQPVECLRPIAPGFYSEWNGVNTHSPHWAAVNDILYLGNAYYVTPGTAGQRDTYTMSNMVANSGPIYGMQWVADFGDGGNTYAPFLRLSGADDQGASFAHGAAGYEIKPYPFNPFTSPGVYWDAGILNALEAGIIIVSSPTFGRFDQFLLEVLGLAQPVVPIAAAHRNRLVQIGGGA